MVMCVGLMLCLTLLACLEQCALCVTMKNRGHPKTCQKL